MAAIYGPPIPPIKAWMRYRTPTRIADADLIVEILKNLYEDLEDVTLCTAFHYVNRLAVFYTISRQLRYFTVSFPLSRSAISIMKELRTVFQIYDTRGFCIVEVHADKEGNNFYQLVCKQVGQMSTGLKTLYRIRKMKIEQYTMPCHINVFQGSWSGILYFKEICFSIFGSKDDIGDDLSPHNSVDNLPDIDYNDLKYEFAFKKLLIP